MPDPNLPVNSQPSWITNLLQSVSYSWKTFINPEDTEETDTEETEYVTQIYELGPVYPQKYILVSSLPDHFTTAELSEGYHTPSEYAEANTRFGNIFKHQKFENADNVETLYEYAMDWIKNNYHAGLTSFDISAIDMHLLDEDTDPYMVGDRVDVVYPDPLSHTETEKTLTCISVEYDLYNPDKNKYKIGVPDAALNKTYGETDKSGGGGGGGNNTEDENDEEDATEQESLFDKVQSFINTFEENRWAFFEKLLPDGEDTDPNYETPKTRDPANPFMMNLLSDQLKTGKADIGQLITRHINSDYLDIGGTISGAKAKLMELVLGGSPVEQVPVTIGGRQYTILAVTEGQQ